MIKNITNANDNSSSNNANSNNDLMRKNNRKYWYYWSKKTNPHSFYPPIIYVIDQLNEIFLAVIV